MPFSVVQIAKFTDNTIKEKKKIFDEAWKRSFGARSEWSENKSSGEKKQQISFLFVSQYEWKFTPLNLFDDQKGVLFLRQSNTVRFFTLLFRFF